MTSDIFGYRYNSFRYARTFQRSTGLDQCRNNVSLDSGTKVKVQGHKEEVSDTRQTLNQRDVSDELVVASRAGYAQ